MKKILILSSGLLIIAICGMISACQKQINYQPQIATLQGQVSALQQRCDSLQAALQSSNNTVLGLSAEVLTLTNTQQGQAKYLDTVRTQIASILTSIEAINTKVSTDETSIAALTAQLAQTNANVSAIDAQITTLDNQITQLNTQYSVLINQINNIINQLAQVSTFAGSGAAGSADGQGTAASFVGPTGVAVDRAGNVYVADQTNHLIREISPSGLVSTLAGTGAAGSANGQGTAASFFFPTGVAVDGAGNVYVADQGNNLIREISPSGLVSTLAGSGAAGSADGQATAASFHLPSGIAVDGAGNVYVADYGNNLIRKINPLGVVSTLAGSGTTGSANGQGIAASFYLPFGVAVDGAGNVYVADYGNNLIRKINPLGLVSTLAGSGAAGSANGQGTVASFSIPTGVAIDAAGNVYVADQGNNLIREISPSGLVSTLAGSGAAGSANGQGTVASFKYPSGVAVDAAGNVYVADRGNIVIRKVTF